MYRDAAERGEAPILNPATETMSQKTVDAYLSELKSGRFFASADAPHSFDYMVDYYRRKSGTRRIWFRTCSVLLIVFSSTLPFVSAFGNVVLPSAFKDVVVAALSALIALLAALLAHFKWEVGWRSHNEALFALEALRTEWEGDVAKAHAAADEATARPVLQDAFERFRSRTYEVVHGEMGEFFKVQRAPERVSSEGRGA